MKTQLKVTNYKKIRKFELYIKSRSEQMSLDEWFE